MTGEGVSRIEGPLKVSGRIRYSAERQLPTSALNGAIVGARIGRGRIVDIRTAAAETAPGVRLVWTHRNAPQQASRSEKGDLFGVHPELADDRVYYHGMPVAFVVADSFERARAAADLIEVDFNEEQVGYDLAALTANTPWNDEFRSGEFEQAIADSPVMVDATFTTPYHFSHPMEPNACVADWREGHLTLYIAAQLVSQLGDFLADTILLGREHVTVDAAYVGGAFGSKGGLHSECVLASLATLALGEPVKVVMTRRQIFTLVGHRAATINRIRVGATRDGQITAIGHDAWAQTSCQDSWKENPASVSRALYAAPNRLTRHAYPTVEVGAAEPVRGPGEVPGLLTFESVVDELAEQLGIDPVELRLRNDTQVDAENGRPLSSRRLGDCLREGARQFRWEERPTKPGSRRDGNQLIGLGVASSIRGHFQMETEASVEILPGGQVIVRSDMTDVGTGARTIAAQIAAEGLGVSRAQVDVQFARSDLPRGWGGAGSWGSGNTSVAIDRACQNLRQRIEKIAGTGYNDIFAEVRRYFPDGVLAKGKSLSSGDDPNYRSHAQYTYGANFAEVGVDSYSGEVRVRRLLGVFAAGRIINAKTARSQMIGGMVWGIGAALHEAAHVDHRSGAWINGDLAEYLIPVHADVPDVDVVLLDDFDERANHLGVKGIGELGTGGTAASIANAVYNATGVRVRDFPITLDKLLPGLQAFA